MADQAKNVKETNVSTEVANEQATATPAAVQQEEGGRKLSKGKKIVIGLIAGLTAIGAAVGIGCAIKKHNDPNPPEGYEDVPADN